MKKYSWKELRKVRDEGEINYFLRHTPEKYRMGFALALAMLKWEPGCPDRGGGSCALCELRDFTSDTCDVIALNDEGYRPCPLKEADEDRSCSSWGSLWNHWSGARDSRNLDKKKEFADKLYSVLARLHEKEYRRLKKEVRRA